MSNLKHKRPKLVVEYLPKVTNVNMTRYHGPSGWIEYEVLWSDEAIRALNQRGITVDREGR